MAENIKLECKIHEIKQVPNTRTYLISIQYTQGKKTWFKPWKFTPNQPVSMEWLEREVAKLDPWPEADLMQNVMEEKDKSFSIEVEPPKPEGMAQDVADATEQFNPQPQQQQVSVTPGTVLE